jgi:hypothetical protein
VGAKVEKNWSSAQAQETCLVYWAIVFGYPGVGKSQPLERITTCLAAAVGGTGIDFNALLCDDSNTPEGRQQKLRESQHLLNSQDEIMNLLQNMGRNSKTKAGAPSPATHLKRRPDTRAITSGDLVKILPLADGRSLKGSNINQGMMSGGTCYVITGTTQPGVRGSAAAACCCLVHPAFPATARIRIEVPSLAAAGHRDWGVNGRGCWSCAAPHACLCRPPRG